MNTKGKKSAATLPLVRCAVYTRKSTEEGLEQEFNADFRGVENNQPFLSVSLVGGFRDSGR
jgi:hypothetical protein